MSDSKGLADFAADVLGLPLTSAQRELLARIEEGASEIDPRVSLRRATQEQIDRARRSTLPAPNEDDMQEPKNGFDFWIGERLCEACGLLVPLHADHHPRDCIAQRLENAGNLGRRCPWCDAPYLCARDADGRVVFEHARTCPRKADK